MGGKNSKANKAAKATNYGAANYSAASAMSPTAMNVGDYYQAMNDNGQAYGANSNNWTANTNGNGNGNFSSSSIVSKLPAGTIGTNSQLDKKIMNRNTIVVAVLLMDGCHYCEEFKPDIDRAIAQAGNKILKLKSNDRTSDMFNYLRALMKVSGFPSVIIARKAPNGQVQYNQYNLERTTPALLEVVS